MNRRVGHRIREGMLKATGNKVGVCQRKPSPSLLQAP